MQKKIKNTNKTPYMYCRNQQNNRRTPRQKGKDDMRNIRRKIGTVSCTKGHTRKCGTKLVSVKPGRRVKAVYNH